MYCTNQIFGHFQSTCAFAVRVSELAAFHMVQTCKLAILGVAYISFLVKITIHLLQKFKNVLKKCNFQILFIYQMKKARTSLYF